MSGYQPYPSRNPRGGGRGGGGGKGRRGQDEPTGPVDRRSKCPLLIRVCIKESSRTEVAREEARKQRTNKAFLGQLFDIAQLTDRKRSKETGEILMHTWKDATFRELLTSILKVCNIQDTSSTHTTGGKESEQPRRGVGLPRGYCEVARQG